MNIYAVRDDGALLVTAGGEAAAIIIDGGVYLTTRGSALARGDWDSDVAGHVVPAELRVGLPDRLVQLDRELADADLLTREVTSFTAGLVPHTGAMIALVPTEEDAARLAVDGGEDADELHVTLGYLGEAALLPEELQHDLVECISQCVSSAPTIVGNAFAVATFNPETGAVASSGYQLDEVEDLVAGAGGPEPCVVLLLSGSQLAPTHARIMADVAKTFAASGVELHQQHSPWVAHLTLVYTAEADLAYFTDRIGPVTFDRVRLAFGDEVYDVPLGDHDDS